MKVKKGDNVTVLAGKDKGKSGKILRALPKVNKVVIEGLNTVKKHQRAKNSGQKGQILDRPMPIHVSNIILSTVIKKKSIKKSKKPTKNQSGK